MSISPFKFLDNYNREDRAIFFGHDQEKRHGAWSMELGAWRIKREREGARERMGE